ELEPPASTKPRPRPQFEPSWASQPPLQTQCANSGYVQPARSAVEAQLAPRRQRSAPAPSGIIAASPTLSIPSHAASDAGEPSSLRARKKNGPAAIQFHSLPATVKTCADWPTNPCQENPQMK